MQSALLIWEGNAECLWGVHTAAMPLLNNVQRERERERGGGSGREKWDVSLY